MPTPTLQGAVHLSLSEAFKLADEHNPQILAARDTVLQARASVGIAREIPNPELQTLYGFGPTTTRLQSPQMVSLTQVLETGGKRKARTNLALSQMTLADAQLNSLRQDVRAQVRHAYADLVAAEETASQLREQEKLLRELIDIAEKRYKAGAAPQAEVVQATLSHNQIIPLQAQADGRIRQAHIQLDTLLGKSLPSEFDVSDKDLSVDNGVLKIRIKETRLAPELQLPPLETLEQQAFDHRYDLQAALKQVTVGQKQLALTRSQRYPDLELGGGYLFFPDKDKLVQGVFTTLNVTLPVYHNQKSETQRDTAALHQNQALLTAMRQRIDNEVETAYAALQTAIVNVHLYEDQLLPQAEDLGQLARLSYQVGKTGLANVILAQQSVLQVRSGYLDAMINYQRALADMEKAIGGPLEQAD
jgi:cobalt-zinc-cadmium efflux system outer membrane protein